MWSSLVRAGGDHWTNEATIVPSGGGGGYMATLQVGVGMDDSSWTAASKYIRRYARASHWKVQSLARRRTHVEMVLEHAPPTKKAKKKRRPEQRPASQKTDG